jgi:hypothetical protein
LTASAASASAVVEREKEADRGRAPPFLHQLARHIVDRRDMVGIDRMAQPQPIGEEGSAQQHRLRMEQEKRPAPGRKIDGGQQRVKPDHA